MPWPISKVDLMKQKFNDEGRNHESEHAKLPHQFHRIKCWILDDMESLESESVIWGHLSIYISACQTGLAQPNSGWPAPCKHGCF